MAEIDREAISGSASGRRGDGVRGGGGLEALVGKVLGTYHFGTMGAKPTSWLFAIRNLQ